MWLDLRRGCSREAACWKWRRPKSSDGCPFRKDFNVFCHFCRCRGRCRGRGHQIGPQIKTLRRHPGPSRGTTRYQLRISCGHIAPQSPNPFSPQDSSTWWLPSWGESLRKGVGVKAPSNIFLGGMHSEEDCCPIVLPQHLTCDNEHHYGLLVKFSRFWGLARHTNFENFLPRPCPIDPSTDPMQFWPSWAPSSTIFGMCWVILNYIFAHFGRTTRPRWTSWAFLG